MKIPDAIYKTKEPVTLPAQTVKPVVTKRLKGFKMRSPKDERGMWCWAVVAEAVSEFYPRTPDKSQCCLAKKIVGANCCSKYRDCDRPQKLDDALKLTGNFASGPNSSAPLFSKIESETDKRRPVCCRLNTVDGHFVTIVSTSTDGSKNMLEILDPDKKKPVPFEYNNFVKNHLTHTYCTKG